MRSSPGSPWFVTVAAAVVCVSIATVWTPGPASAQTPEDSAAIRARIDAYLGAWDAHDAPALATFFSPDADLVMGNQPEARGRGAIQASWGAYFENQEPERRLELDVGPLRFPAPGIALMTVVTTTE